MSSTAVLFSGDNVDEGSGERGRKFDKDEDGNGICDDNERSKVKVVEMAE